MTMNKGLSSEPGMTRTPNSNALALFLKYCSILWHPSSGNPSQYFCKKKNLPFKNNCFLHCLRERALKQLAIIRVLRAWETAHVCAQCRSRLTWNRWVAAPPSPTARTSAQKGSHLAGLADAAVSPFKHCGAGIWDAVNTAASWDCVSHLTDTLRQTCWGSWII